LFSHFSILKLFQLSRDRNEGAETDESRMERENGEFYRRVAGGYRQLLQAHPKRIRAIDATGAIEAVQKRVDQAVNEILALVAT
jgi:thymidylate kinase